MSTIESVKQVLLVSGAGWVLWLLGGLSISSLVARDRALALPAAPRRQSRGAGARARRAPRGATTSSARATLLEASPAVAARVADAGLRLADRGTEAAEKAMQSAAALERGRLERWLAFLATVGNNAPFVGLFGTVVGVIHAFEELGHAAPGHGATAAGQVASQAVMASIAEALVATAVGILVALPAVAAYNYLQRRVDLAAVRRRGADEPGARLHRRRRAPAAARRPRSGRSPMAAPSGQQNGGIISGINVTPLVDVMLVLLVIFIVTAKIIVTPAVPLDLPHAAHGEEVQVVLSVIVPVRGADARRRRAAAERRRARARRPAPPPRAIPTCAPSSRPTATCRTGA